MDELSNTIYNLETALLKPEVRNSIEQLDNLLANDFREFGSSGLIYTKEDMLKRLPSNTDKVVFTVSNFQVIPISENVALSTFKTERTTNDIEKISSLRTSLWRNEEGVWKIFFHQGTPIQ